MEPRSRSSLLTLLLYLLLQPRPTHSPLSALFWRSRPSLVCYWTGFPFSIAAIIFGLIARGRIARSGGLEKGKGLALAGVILGFLLPAVIIAIYLLISLLSPQIEQIFSRIVSTLEVP